VRDRLGKDLTGKGFLQGCGADRLSKAHRLIGRF